MTLNEYVHEMDSVRILFEKKMEELQKESSEMLNKTFLSFFEEVPEVGSITWTQYIPYFNDGEPCEFTVSDFSFFPKGEDDEEFDEYDDNLYYSENVDPEVKEKIKTMSRALNNFPTQFLENLFGTYAKVIVTRNGIEVEEYDAPY